MLFNSFTFLAFFTIVYALYLVLGRRGQNRMLLVASLLFYGCWSWKFLTLLCISIVVDYSVGVGLESIKDERKRRWLLTASLVNGLTLLGLFKYYNFFIANLIVLLSHFHIDGSALRLNLVLPVGISFYTFHTMSYVIDVYEGQLPACRNFIDFALFVAYFPQLVAGPIARARQLLPQMQRERRIDPDQFIQGLYLVGYGLFKKVIIADGCSHIVNAVFGNDSAYSGLDHLLAIYAFAFQIYGDFSGYSDVARGLAKMMGFELTLNFNLPYFAIDPPDFWRRWHISLSSWLRDYLYIPLGGNRSGTWRTYRNLFLTMLIGGIWHGASWTMVLWGAFHGTILIIHRLIRGASSAEEHPSVLKILFMFQVTCLGWLIFRADSVGQIGRFLAAVFTDIHSSRYSRGFAVLLVQLVGPLVAYECWQYRRDVDDSFFARISDSARATIIAGVSFVTLVFVVFHRTLLQGEVPFIYFQF